MTCGVKFVGIESRDGETVAHLLVGGHDEFCRTPDELMVIATEAREACAALVTARAKDLSDAAKRVNEEHFRTWTP